MQNRLDNLLYVIMRITAGAFAWRKVGGVMGDRRISRKRKGHMLSWCVTPPYMNALETMAVTEKQQKVQGCENNPGKKNRGSYES